MYYTRSQTHNVIKLPLFHYYTSIMRDTKLGGLSSLHVKGANNLGD